MSSEVSRAQRRRCPPTRTVTEEMERREASEPPIYCGRACGTPCFRILA